MRHNLLIVDDEELIRQGLKARIEYLEIDVDEIFEAENGNEALEMVDLHSIDIVITDIKMPDMNGIELIQEIQKRKNGIQFVVLSGYAEFSYAETAIRLGVKAYLLKPLSNDELKQTFQRLYEEMESNAKMRYIERQQKKLDREKQEYLLEKDINAIFAGATDEALSIDKLEHMMNRNENHAFHKSCVYLAIIHVDKESYKDNGFHKMDHELIRFSVKNVFYEVDSSCEKIIVNSLSDYNKLYGIFIMDDEKRLRNEIERIFLKMRSVLEKKMEIYLTFGVSRCAEDIRIDSVKEAANNSVQAAKNKIESLKAEEAKKAEEAAKNNAANSSNTTSSNNSSSQPSSDGKYKKTLSMEATAYSGGTLTAMGLKPVRDPGGISTIAVDPSVIPLGSKVYIPGYGYAIASDTGGVIKGNIIDLYMNSHDEFISWGRRQVTLHIVAYPGEW